MNLFIFKNNTEKFLSSRSTDGCRLLASYVNLRKSILVFLLVCVPTLGFSDNSFVSTNKGTFYRNDAPYNYLGANLWNAMFLGSSGPGGDRPRLIRELDHLQQLGVRNLRILGGSEGTSTSLQAAPGQYDPSLLQGLDFALDEMKKRDMTAVIMLTNFWDWSGGMSQYLKWSGQTGPASGQTFVDYTSQFYLNKAAMNLYFNFIQMIIGRKNSISNLNYVDDPTIMAWELSNEPRGAKQTDPFNAWINQTAGLIKSLDPRHLVTTGSEGNYTDSNSGLDLIKNHSSPNIDYATLHVWVQNMGKYNAADAVNSYPKATQWVANLITMHRKLQMKLGKPLVLEEFGLARDVLPNQVAFDPATPTTYRDKYFNMMFEYVRQAVLSDQTFGGVNFWVWGGENNPPVATPPKPGEPTIGTMGYEPAGWYDVLGKDASTLEVISACAQKMAEI